MTQAARITPTPTGRAERARQVEEAVHSVRMEGLDLAQADAADAAEYVAGRITLDEFGQRIRDRYGVHEAGQQTDVTPVRGSATETAPQSAGTAFRAAQRGR